MDGCKGLSIKSCRCRRRVGNCKNSYFRVKNFYGRDHFSGVTFCRSFFDGADVLTLSEKKDVFIMVSYVFLRRKMSIEQEIWFYKNLRKKDVESAWQSVETGV